MKNYSRLQQLEKKTEGAFFLIEDPTDLFYLTGVKFSKGSMLVGKESSLFVDGRYTEAAKGVKGVTSFSDKEFYSYLCDRRVEKIYFDKDKTSYRRYETLIKEVKQTEFIAQDSLVMPLRQIKEDQEIRGLKKAATLNQAGLEHAAQFLKEGVTEKEIALEYEIFCLRNGGQRVAFEPIVAFGENSALPHHRAGSRKLKNKDVVLIDVGIFVDDYASDMTRCFFFKDKDPLLFSLYEEMQKFHAKLLSEMKEGVLISLLDKKAREWMKELGFTASHSLGHGLGLEVHESPRIAYDENLKDVLKENMVITIEPGLYIPGRGGLRYEDTLVVKKEKIENFYKPAAF